MLLGMSGRDQSGLRLKRLQAAPATVGLSPIEFQDSTVRPYVNSASPALPPAKSGGSIKIRGVNVADIDG